MGIGDWGLDNELNYSSVKKVENKIISFHNKIYWMFIIINLNTKEARVHCALIDRNKEKLMHCSFRFNFTLTVKTSSTLE